MMVQTLLLGSSPLPRPRWRQTGRGRAISSTRVFLFYPFLTSLLFLLLSFLSLPFSSFLFPDLASSYAVHHARFLFLGSLPPIFAAFPVSFLPRAAARQGQGSLQRPWGVLVTPPRCQLRPPTPASRSMARPDKHYYRGASIQDSCCEEVEFTASTPTARDWYCSSSCQILLIR